ncbi:MAG: CHAT domain-containing protein [Acidobacteria bacterium]|nr:CHAT domain-containing protein [Acidobacteriota bacterium]
MAALSLGVAGAFLPSCRARRTPEDAIASVRSWRLAEPRLTTAQEYVPCRTDPSASDLVPDSLCGAPRLSRRPPLSSAGAQQRGGTDSPDLAREASGDLSARVAQSQDREDLDRGVKSLERRCASRPGDARAWSDLAAAYLVRAERLDEPQDLARALAAVERAIERDPALREARFNQAIALERLFLTVDAGRAWQAYRALDGGSPWSGEARQRIDALARPTAEAAWKDVQETLRQAALRRDVGTVRTLVQAHRQAAREYAEVRALGDWAEALARKDAAAAKRALTVARAIGEALINSGGERLVRQSVAHIDEASRSRNARRLRDLVEGHLQYRRGYELYNDRHAHRAGLRLKSAWKALRRAGSPLAARVSFVIACNDHLCNRYPPALARLKRLRRDLADGSNPGLLGYVLWMEALNQGVTGRLMEAVTSYEESIAWFQRAGERENTATVEALFAESLQLLGRNREAWRHAYKALRLTPELRDPKLLAFIFRVAADSALQDNLEEAALGFQSETLRQAKRSNRVLYAETLLWRALVEDRLGRHAQAMDDLQEADRAVERIEDTGVRSHRRVDLALARATLTMKDDPRAAISLLTRPASVYERTGRHVYTLRALLARARAYRLAGEDDRAEKDLDAALRAYERLGEDPRQEDLRLAFLEETSQVFDEMIDLQLRRGRPDLALVYADLARTRVLPDSASRIRASSAEKRKLLAAEPRALGLAEIRRRLPGAVTLVQLSVLPDRVLVGLIRRENEPGRELSFERKIPRQQLERLVASARDFRPGGEELRRQAASELFDLLVRPWYGVMGTGERLVFIPDKVLHSLPFSSLVDQTTGRYLLEDHPVAVSPSATLYVNALAHDESKGPRAEARPRGLAVGDPAIDRKRFPLLSSLSAAADEARKIAALYGIQALTGPAADKETFLARARQAEWIHFAGHSVVDERNTLLSMLVLAPSPSGDPGILYAREIYPLDLARTRLVVLAACDSGRDYVPGGEGVTSLARAFLAAGVRTVVASLWNVDDRATSHLFYVFHRNLLAHGDPVSALREAQLELLAHGDPAERSPKTWGAFEAFGASVH